MVTRPPSIPKFFDILSRWHPGGIEFLANRLMSQPAQITIAKHATLTVITVLRFVFPRTGLQWMIMVLPHPICVPARAAGLSSRVFCGTNRSGTTSRCERPARRGPRRRSPVAVGHTASGKSFFTKVSKIQTPSAATSGLMSAMSTPARSAKRSSNSSCTCWW